MIKALGISCLIAIGYKRALIYNYKIENLRLKTKSTRVSDSLVNKNMKRIP